MPKKYIPLAIACMLAELAGCTMAFAAAITTPSSFSFPHVASSTPLALPMLASTSPSIITAPTPTTDTVPLASTTSDLSNTAPTPIDYSGLIPDIINVAASPTATSSLIIWETSDQVSNSQVTYGTTTSYPATTTSSELSIDHSITLQGLEPGTTYHYMVSSSNGYGTVTSPDQIFTTAGAEGVSTAPPVQSMLVVMPPKNNFDTTALVSWTTNQPTMAWVLYGPTQNYVAIAPSDADLEPEPGQDHIFILTGLEPGMTYYFKIVSQNAEGAWSASAGQTFTTKTVE